MTRTSDAKEVRKKCGDRSEHDTCKCLHVYRRNQRVLSNYQLHRMSTPPETPDSFTLQPKSKSLFAESPLLSFNPRSTGPGGDDMSLSELSLGSDATPHRFLPPSRVAEPAQPPRFSLFGPSQSPQAVRTQDEVDEDDDADQSYIVEQSDVGHESAPATPRAEDRRHTQEEDSMNGEAAADASGVEATLNAGAPKRAAPDPRQREEELRSTLFQLQSLNTVLREYMETLHDTEANNRVGERIMTVTTKKVDADLSCA